MRLGLLNEITPFKNLYHIARTDLDIATLAGLESAEAILAGHPDLYVRDGDKVRLAIHDGDLLTGSLTTPGFATSVHPDWSAMSPLAQPTAGIPLEKAV